MNAMSGWNAYTEMCNLHLQLAFVTSTRFYSYHLHLQLPHTAHTCNFHIQLTLATPTYSSHLQLPHKAHTCNFHTQLTLATSTHSSHLQLPHTSHTCNFHIKLTLATYTQCLAFSNATYTWNLHWHLLSSCKPVFPIQVQACKRGHVASTLLTWLVH